MYRYRPYQRPRLAAKAKARKTLAIQTATIGGVVGFSVMVAAIAASLSAGH